MIEAMEHFIDDAGLDLVVEVGEREIVCRSENGKPGIEIIRSMGENKGTSVDVTQSEVEGRRGEWRGGKRDC